MTHVIDRIKLVPPLTRVTDSERRAGNGGKGSGDRRFDIKRLDAASAVGRRDGHLLIGITAVCDDRRNRGRKNIER